MTDKHDVVAAVRAALAGNPLLQEQLNWLLKVWNTDDDRAFEEFDATKPYGADYEPPDEDDGADDLDIRYRCPTCSHCWEEVWTAACDSTCPACACHAVMPLMDKRQDEAWTRDQSREWVEATAAALDSRAAEDAD